MCGFLPLICLVVSAETLLMDMHRSKAQPLNVCIARLFNTYGPFMDPKDGRVISNMVIQALKGTYMCVRLLFTHFLTYSLVYVRVFVCNAGQPMTVYGTGEQTRSFCYVDDTVAGLVALMNSTELGPINIGNPVERSIRDAAVVIARVTGVPLNVVNQELPKDDPTKRRPDITLATTRLNWCALYVVLRVMKMRS